MNKNKEDLKGRTTDDIQGITSLLANNSALDLSDNAINKLSICLPLSLIDMDLQSSKFVQLINLIMENERQMARKVPHLKKGENARTPLAIELSCLALHVTVPRDELLSVAGIKKNDYLQALEKCTKLMGFQVQNRKTIEMFAIKYSSVDTGTSAYSLLESYEQQHEAKHKFQQPLDYQSALYQAAAFFIAAKVRKLKSVPRRDQFFATLDLTNGTLFTKVCDDMEALSQQSSDQDAQSSMSGTSARGVTLTTTSSSSSSSSSSSAAAAAASVSFRGDGKTPTSGGVMDSHGLFKSEILQSAPQNQSQDMHSQFFNMENEQSSHNYPGMSKKKVHSNVQFNNVKSVEMRKAAELEAVEKKRKSIELYTAWKRAVLYKRSCRPVICTDDDS